MQRHILILLGALLLGVSSACSGGAPAGMERNLVAPPPAPSSGLEPLEPTDEPVLPPEGADTVEWVPQPSFLDMMVSAPEMERYSGVRRLEFSVPIADEAHYVEYRERVGSDGFGNFGVEPIELVQGRMEEELFFIFQEQIRTFLYRYRDFRIQSVPKFLANYTLIVTDPNVQIAGVQCVEMHIQRAIDPTNRYIVWVDPSTALALGWEEYDEDNRLLGRMTFETFEPDFVPEDLELGGDMFRTMQVDVTLPGTADFGFAHLIPEFVPAGYRFEDSVQLSDPRDKVWIKQIYGDGIEQLVFMYTEEDSDIEDPGTMTALRVGLWHVISGRMFGRPVIIAGKATRESLFDTLQSAF